MVQSSIPSINRQYSRAAVSQSLAHWYSPWAIRSRKSECSGSVSGQAFSLGLMSRPWTVWASAQVSQQKPYSHVTFP